MPRRAVVRVAARASNRARHSGPVRRAASLSKSRSSSRYTPPQPGQVYSSSSMPRRSPQPRQTYSIRVRADGKSWLDMELGMGPVSLESCTAVLLRRRAVMCGACRGAGHAGARGPKNYFSGAEAGSARPSGPCAAQPHPQGACPSAGAAGSAGAVGEVGSAGSAGSAGAGSQPLPAASWCFFCQGFSSPRASRPMFSRWLQYTRAMTTSASGSSFHLP